MLKQTTVFLENKPGRIEEVTSRLADKNINIHALSLADTTDYGILRMIVSDPEKALKALKENNFMVKTSDVVAVALNHSPGSLHKVLTELKKMDISIEYMYAFTSRHKDYDAIVILSLNSQHAALDTMKGSDIHILDENFIAHLNES
jgi:hypothetical protein